MIRISAALAFVFLTIQTAFATPVTILALGDSLMAGLGLEVSEAFPARLEAALEAKGLDVRIVNAGVSGDTATAGLARLDWVLTDEVDGLIVELGANDALRGLDPARTEAALNSILDRAAARKLPVLIAGMRAPPNLGPDYVAAFDAIYRRLAEKHGAILYPFFLAGVAAEPSLNQTDGIHPNRKGVEIIVERIMPSVEGLIRRAAEN
jgi:acyl-CoA thioesterase-1